MTSKKHKVFADGDGLRLMSGVGRDLIFKVTGDDTGGAFDYFVVQVAPKGGPLLHVHHKQEETIHVLKGRFKVRIGDELYFLEEGGFAYLPSNVPHAFVNLTDDPAELIVVFCPGGGHKFFEELGPLTRGDSPDLQAVAALCAKYNITNVGPALEP